jgi:hypothetical protein
MPGFDLIWSDLVFLPCKRDTSTMCGFFVPRRWDQITLLSMHVTTSWRLRSNTATSGPGPWKRWRVSDVTSFLRHHQCHLLAVSGVSVPIYIFLSCKRGSFRQRRSDVDVIWSGFFLCRVNGPIVYTTFNYSEQVVWYNKEIKVQNKCLFIKEFYEKGLITFSDISLQTPKQNRLTTGPR